MARTILMGHDFMEETGVAVSGGTPASSSFALTNVLDPQPSLPARFSNDTPANTYFVFNLASPVFFNERYPLVVFIGYTNLSDSATFRVRAASSEANLTNGNATYDSGNIQFWHNPNLPQDELFPRGVSHLHYEPTNDETAGNEVWWQVEFSDASNPDGYVEVGVISIGNPFVATNPIANGWSFGTQTSMVGQTAMGGQRYRRAVAGTNVLEATFQLTSQSEALELHSIIRNRAEAKPMLMCIDPEDDPSIMNLTAWGHMTATQPITVPFYGLWQTTLRIEEMP